MNKLQELSLKRRQFLGQAARYAALTAAGLSIPAHAIGTKVSLPIATTDGPVVGVIDKDVHTFLGIPYAAPPIGKLRFQPPQPPAQRKTPLGAVLYGHSAMQLSSGGAAVSYPGSVGIALSQVFGSREDLMLQNEDCLTLNIWSPGIEGEKRAVMVWFHGGGFNYGSGSWPSYNGHNLARNKDVIVVTVNHRLNAFGFLNLANIGGEQFRQSGNAGQLDLIRSLEWVRDNIENFGGNPDNVTIFGQSGGGAKVSTLTTMPEAKEIGRAHV